MSTHKVAVIGAAGRMGGELVDALADSQDLTLGAPVVRDLQAHSDYTVADVDLLDDIAVAADRCDVIIEFSSPQGAVDAARRAEQAAVPLVSGTTGLNDAQLDELKDAATSTPMVRASNFSVGINVLSRLVRQASAATDGDFDIEISEAHHRHKVDAPSGTALSLAEAAADARDWDLDEVARHGREGAVGERPDREIGFQVTRGGSIVGDHTVQLCGPGERLELTHRSGDRGIFAQGALRAARWLLDSGGRSPGIYDMQSVLFGETT